MLDTCPQDDCWLSGSEDAEVRQYAKDRGEMVGLVTSANAVPIRSVAIDPKGKRVAVASE
jgi:chromosome transmission fidelity protein 4